MGQGNEQPAAVEDAVAAIKRATQQKKIYVLFSGSSFMPARDRDIHWMLALDPEGRELLRYDKLYDQPKAAMPGVFRIDGIPCNAIICADRWLRGIEEVPIQQGAQVSFELSCNSVVEWVAPLAWYWYVPRAVRNNVWVIFANTGNAVTGVAPYPGGSMRHAHSAIIAPDGRMVVCAKDDAATIIMAEIDASEATRREALARANHPAMRAFWEAGMKRQTGAEITVPAFKPYESPAIDVTIAVAQVEIGRASCRERV